MAATPLAWLMCLVDLPPGTAAWRNILDQERQVAGRRAAGPPGYRLPIQAQAASRCRAIQLPDPGRCLVNHFFQAPGSQGEIVNSSPRTSDSANRSPKGVLADEWFSRRPTWWSWRRNHTVVCHREQSELEGSNVFERNQSIVGQLPGVDPSRDDIEAIP
jgi:hypothetical protein